MKFGQKPTIAQKAATVQNRLAKTTTGASGMKPAPKAKVTAKQTGGLKPNGVKVKWEKRF